jgi:hypothetical protein
MFACLANTFNKFFPYMAACMARRREAQYAERTARRRQARFVRPRLEGLEERIVPDAYQWTGAFSPDFTDPSNWDDLTNPLHQGVPGSMDTADIPLSGNNACVLNSTTDQTVAGLTVEGGFTVNSKLSVTTANMGPGSVFNLGASGELDVLSSADFNGSGTISGHIDDQGATVTFWPGSSMVLATGASLTGSLYNIFGSVTVTGNLNQQATMVLDANYDGPLAGSLTGPGSLTDSSDFDWDGGTIGLAGGTYFQADAYLKLDTSDPKLLAAGTLTNQCNGSELGGTGSLEIAAGATFDNLGNPTCDVTIPLIIVDPGSTPGSFINDADGFFDEKGTTTITGGGSFTNIGDLFVDASAALTLDSLGTTGTTNLDGLLFLDGTLTLLGSVSSPIGFGLNSGSGTLKVGDGSTISSLTIGSGAEALLTGATLEVTGSGTLTGDTVNNNSGVL